MFRFARCAAVGLLMLFGPAQAAVITFDTDPFEGTDALTTPGRQIVGNELFVTFDVASDVFAFDAGVFGVGDTVLFANDVVGNLPSGGVNVIVLQTIEDPMAAGIAANLIAAQITSPGPGFFVYFNTGLDLPRLVYSTDLSDNAADLKILARMTNLTGQTGRDALPNFTASNFDIIAAAVPEPSSMTLMAAGLLSIGGGLLRRRRRSGTS